MADQGLQVWDAQGNLTLDVSDRICKILGSVITTWPSGRVELPDLQGNQIFLLFNPVIKNDVAFNAYERPKIIVTNNVISWTYTWPDPAYVVSGPLIYGIY